MIKKHGRNFGCAVHRETQSKIKSAEHVVLYSNTENGLSQQTTPEMLAAAALFVHTLTVTGFVPKSGDADDEIWNLFSGDLAVQDLFECKFTRNVTNLNHQILSEIEQKIERIAGFKIFLKNLKL